MQSSSYVLLMACFAVTVQLGLGIKCYHCSSESNEACDDPFKLDPKERAHVVDLIDCTPDLAQRAISNAVHTANRISSALGFSSRQFQEPDVKMACIKADIKMKEKQYVTRSCGIEPKGDLDACKIIRETAAKTDGTASVTFCDFCTADGCNGAASTSASIGIFAATLVVLWGYLH